MIHWVLKRVFTFLHVVHSIGGPLKNNTTLCRPMADGSFTGILEASTEAVVAWLLGPNFEALQYSFFPSTLPAPQVYAIPVVLTSSF